MINKNNERNRLPLIADSWLIQSFDVLKSYKIHEMYAEPATKTETRADFETSHTDSPI